MGKWANPAEHVGAVRAMVSSLAGKWEIPGVGALQPCIDRVEIVSRASVGAIKTFLPVAELKAATHIFDVRRYTGKDPGLKSRLVVVGTRSSDPWGILARYLRRYRITKAEIAFDVDAGPIDDARERLLALFDQLGKPWHRRRHICSVHEPEKVPPEGCVAEPTLYLEDRKASVALKCYLRQQASGRSVRQTCDKT
jgi:hypothetical protein